MAREFTVGIVGCGRMGGTIDDEVEGHPFHQLPYSHAAAYKAVPETRIVAAADVDEAKAKSLCERYDVPKAYTDYREMIVETRPEIVSITTRPGNHAEITRFAAEHGVRGIYLEKPLCASMAEADAMVDACERHGVKFNLGTNRRFLTQYRLMRAQVESGVIGQLQSVIAVASGNALWSHTHTTDMLLFLAGDPAVTFVQGCTNVTEEDFADNRTDVDPAIRFGYVSFANGVGGFVVPAGGYNFELHGTEGKLFTTNDTGGVIHRKQEGPWRLTEEVPFPRYPRESAAVLIIRDLLQAIETDGDTLNNIRTARLSHEIVTGFVESHRRKGAQVALPLDNRGLYLGQW